MTRNHLAIAFSTLALVATAGLLTAGPLNPPAGAVAPTAKPLSEVERIHAASTVWPSPHPAIELEHN
mgnify:CR=1 FL=1